MKERQIQKAENQRWGRVLGSEEALHPLEYAIRFTVPV